MSWTKQGLQNLSRWCFSPSLEEAAGGEQTRCGRSGRSERWEQEKKGRRKELASPCSAEAQVACLVLSSPLLSGIVFTSLRARIGTTWYRTDIYQCEHGPIHGFGLGFKTLIEARQKLHPSAIYATLRGGSFIHPFKASKASSLWWAASFTASEASSQQWAASSSESSLCWTSLWASSVRLSIHNEWSFVLAASNFVRNDEHLYP